MWIDETFELSPGNPFDGFESERRVARI